ncbi:MAG: SUMF1/EgtB/PvdO family nonheme iron enzyme [Myxococcales bacterium]|nr:SUMF1/EgtB/PvdO family nonheme iron enzyme [Myxococcales bacterium]
MGTVRPDAPVGDALFVAGYDPGAGGEDDPRLAHLTRLASVLLASATAWRLRRLAPHGGDRDAPSRGNVRRELDALFGRAAAQRLIIIAAPLTRTVEGLALVCAPELGGFREDASVPLEWIGLRLRRAEVVPTALILITTGSAADARAALDALGAGHAAHVVAVDVDAPAAALAALVDAIEHAAIDPGTGAVTPRSLAATLGARATAAVHPATDAQALVRLRGGHGADAGADAELPGGFRLGAELGRGRFGVVYRARQALTGREVALKLLEPRALADAQAFVTEVQALARVDHPGVVRVLHADTTADGRPFLAMELVTGATLTATIGDGPLAPGVAHELGRQLVGALAAAHAVGVVHGDVSPDNVLVAHGPPARAVLIDFGMARLRGGGAAAGGTRGYLTPEVLVGDPITPRTDVFAAALVLVRMLAGPAALIDHRAALATLPPGAQRAALTRALDPDPAKRFADAGALAAALGVDRAIAAPARPPFRMAAPFGEDDRGDFHGRAAEIERLLEQVLFRAAVAYVAPSGTGKTSLLRAGLIPRLRALDIEVVYVACRAGVEVDVAALLGAPGRPLPEVLAERVAATPRRLVLLIDQIEAALTDAHDASRGAAVLERLDLPRWPRDAPVAVLWSVREEYLARLLDRAQRLAPGLPLVRLGPLTPAIARAVFEQTLAARQVAIAPALLEVLIADLTAAAAGLAAELGWGDAPAVYPPHLQLAGSVLYDARGDGPLDRALYDRLGGLATILREHLRHVLEDELSPNRTAIARALLGALVSTGHLRVARAERELVARVARPDDAVVATDVIATLHDLRERGVVVATAGADGEPVWDLAHDSLVAQVERWMVETDSARTYALERIRDHLRHPGADGLELLTAAELRQIVPHVAAADLAALDQEWASRPSVPTRAATWLVATSRRAVRRRRVALVATTLVALGVVGFLAVRWQAERDLRRRQLAVRDRDLGRSLLVIRAFDWDPVTLTATDTTAARFTWTLVRPDPADDARPGPPFAPGDLTRRPQTAPAGAVGAELVIARGGPAVLVIDRVDRAGRPCTPAIVPIRRLTGYRSGAAPMPLDLRVPTCEGTRAGMIEVEAGPFIAGGVGEPPSEVARDKGQPERQTILAGYALDRTEVPNGFAKAMGAALVAAGYALPLYPDSDQLYQGSEPPWPITAIARRDAAMLCAMAGKRLPSSLEWQKAMRGGATIVGRPNPYPRRNLPWGPPRADALANLKPPEVADRLRFGAPIATGAMPGDVGPYGHLDLAGNVSEWTTADDPRGLAIVRGGNWAETEPDWLVDFLAIDNPRAPNTTMYHIGFRCAVSARP